MTETLDAMPRPETDEVKKGVRNTKVIADDLCDVLAATYRLIVKTYICHWNAKGPLFNSVYSLTEKQYEDMFEAADMLAERIRALGEVPPDRMTAIVEASVVEYGRNLTSANAFCEDLARDHERVAHRCHALLALSGGRLDPVTDDIATARWAFHERAALTLRALARS